MLKEHEQENKNVQAFWKTYTTNYQSVELSRQHIKMYLNLNGNNVRWQDAYKRSDKKDVKKVKLQFNQWYFPV